MQKLSFYYPRWSSGSVTPPRLSVNVCLLIVRLSGHVFILISCCQLTEQRARQTKSDTGPVRLSVSLTFTSATLLVGLKRFTCWGGSSNTGPSSLGKSECCRGYIMFTLLIKMQFSSINWTDSHSGFVDNLSESPELSLPASKVLFKRELRFVKWDIDVDLTATEKMRTPHWNVHISISNLFLVITKQKILKI